LNRAKSIFKKNQFRKGDRVKIRIYPNDGSKDIIEKTGNIIGFEKVSYKLMCKVQWDGEYRGKTVLVPYHKLDFEDFMDSRKIPKVISFMRRKRTFDLYETRVDPLIRFIHMRELEACGWIRIPAGKFIVNVDSSTTSQIDVTCKWRNVHHHETTDIVNIIQASFDIECTSADGSFPQASRPNDKIIQIGTTVREYGNPDFLLKHIITLNTCSPIDGCVVESYKTEKEVLLAWTRLIQRLDPDVLYGYNIFGFDYPYMYDRAKVLRCEGQFSQLSKIKDLECPQQTKTLSSSALGDNTMRLPDLPGRINVDLMKVIQRDHNLVSYKLSAVAEHFINDTKDDVTPAQIFEFQEGTADQRSIIAKYCIQDCALLNDLADKLNILINNMGMANVCSVPLSYIFMRGQGIKIFSLVAKYCRNFNYLIKVVTYNQLFSDWLWKYPNTLNDEDKVIFKNKDKD